MITSDFQTSLLTLFIKDNNNQFTVKSQKNILNKQISSFNIYKENLYVSNIQGDLMVFDYIDNKLKLL